MHSVDSAPIPFSSAPRLPKNTRSWPRFENRLVAERVKSLLPGAAQALPHFTRVHGAIAAWRIDPDTLTPWVFLEFDALPDPAAQSRIEDALQEASASRAFLCWIIAGHHQERLVLHLGSPEERWAQQGTQSRPIPNLRELQTALTLDAPYPMRLARAAALLARKDVTHRFYRDIERSVRGIAAAWTASAEISADHRHELALILIARLMFLHFVQSKNWLPHANYIAEIANVQSDSSYREYWRPLFFDALNLAPDERISGVIPDMVPYLNGGLFAESELEQSYTDLDLPNAVLRQLIFDVFARYAFVDDEHEGHPHAVAPQLLGEIFERLMQPEERQVTGAYYTPHTLALDVWTKALDSFLRARLGVALATKIGQRAPLTHTEASDAFETLWNIRVLDPAVGTGAFLLAALLSLEEETRYVLSFLPEKSLSRRALREQWVTHGLHGIDIQRNAVLLAELRLWLSVTAVAPNTLDAATPLPNLEHRLRVGNALFCPTWKRHEQQSAAVNAQMKELSETLHAFPRQRGDARQTTLDRIRELEAKIARQSVKEQLLALKKARKAQLELLPQDAKITRPCAEEQALQATLNAEGAWQETGAFDPKLHFADVMQNGGFDIVIGNPPWGQISTLDRITQKRLRTRYQVLQGRGGRQSAPDLSVAFFEAYLPLLATDGRMAFVFPAKALRAGWGAAWRQWAQRDATVELLQEMSTHSNHGFHASVYPCICLARRTGSTEVCRPHPALSASTSTTEVLRKGWRVLSAGFRPRYGVKTGRNKAFLVSLDSRLLRALPVVRGKNLRPFEYTCTQKIVFTHDPITANVFDALDDETQAHLAPSKEALTARSDLRSTMPWWTLFRVRQESLGWRVAWRDVAQRLEAVVLPPVSQGGPINLNSTYSVAVENKADAEALCAWLNTDIVSELLTTSAQRARNGYYRFDARVVGSAPIPDALLNDDAPLRAQALSLFREKSIPCSNALARWNISARRIYAASNVTTDDPKLANHPRAGRTITEHTAGDRA